VKVPCSSAQHEGIWRNGSLAAPSLNLTSRWVEWSASLHGTKVPRHPLSWRLGGPQYLAGRFGQQMYLLFLTGNRNTIVLTVSTYPGHRTDWPNLVVLLSALLRVRFVATGLGDRPVTRRIALMNKLLILQTELIICISLVQRQFVVTHTYAVLRETGRVWQISNRPTLKRVMFLGKYNEKQFFVWTQYCVCNTGVFVMRESQFDELCGLRQITVSWALYHLKCIEGIRPSQQKRFYCSHRSSVLYDMFWPTWLSSGNKNRLLCGVVCITALCHSAFVIHMILFIVFLV